jgi:hypothetical protein
VAVPARIAVARPADPAVVDFLLVLGAGEPPPARDAPRLGVWLFEHEAEGSVPFLREVEEGRHVARVALVAVDGARRTLLEEGYFRTDLRSYAATRRRILSCVAAWPARACAQPPLGEAVSGERRGDRRLRLLPYLLRALRHRLGRAWERLFRHPQWTIGVLRAPAAALIDGYDDAAVEWLSPTGRDGFLADPFGVERDGELHALCEEFRYDEGMGRIRTVTGPERRDAVRIAVHASYPFLLEHGGELYCVPETAALGEVALYRAEELPDHWTKAAVLLPEVAGVDPTVFHHDGRWWLFCTRQGPFEDVELWAWHAAEPTGPWTPHARNPVKTDVRGARPGGRPFVHDGHLYRPAQDCSSRYGWRVAIQRVTHLTPTAFSEEQAAVVQASPASAFPLGRHTVCPVGDVVLVDGLRHVFAWPAFTAFLRNWARR